VCVRVCVCMCLCSCVRDVCVYAGEVIHDIL